MFGEQIWLGVPIARPMRMGDGAGGGPPGTTQRGLITSLRALTPDPRPMMSSRRCDPREPLNYARQAFDDRCCGRDATRDDRASDLTGRATRDIRRRHRLGANRKGCAMKLNSAQLERTLGQFEARAIPDDHPVIPQLNDLFGEHTFFLDRNGLNIVEPAEAAAGAAAQSAKVVNLASWSDDDPTGLELHEPEATDIVITFESRH